MAQYQHIGYYNEKEDIEILFNASRDEVVDYYKKGYGKLYPDTEEDREGYWLEHNNIALGVDGDEFIIVKDIPNNKENIGIDSLIDIYKKMPVLDREGNPICKGDIVDWYDPETEDIRRYEVYEEPTEDMVKLWSAYGECEALPCECEVVTERKSRLKKNNAENYESITITLDEERFPIAYAEKKRELMEICGMSEEDAEKYIAESPIELEVYYQYGVGLFGVESEAVECSRIYSPYTQEELEEYDED